MTEVRNAPVAGRPKLSDLEAREQAELLDCQRRLSQAEYRSGQEELRVVGAYGTEPSSYHTIASNDDSYIFSDRTRVYGVYDGMGGEADPQACSRSAAEAFAPLDMSKTFKDANTALEVLRKHHEAAARQADENDRTNTTATTAAIVDTENGEKYLVYAHSGDSRLIVWRSNKLVFETRDQSGGNVVFNAFGAANSQTDDMRRDQFGSFRLEAGDRILICSDGVTGDWDHQKLDAKEMDDAFSQPTPRESVDTFTKISKKDDDTTAIVLFIEDGAQRVDSAEDLHPKSSLWRKTRDVVGKLSVAAAIASKRVKQRMTQRTQNMPRLADARSMLQEALEQTGVKRGQAGQIPEVDYVSSSPKDRYLSARANYIRMMAGKDSTKSQDVEGAYEFARDAYIEDLVSRGKVSEDEAIDFEREDIAKLIAEERSLGSAGNAHESSDTADMQRRKTLIGNLALSSTSLHIKNRVKQFGRMLAQGYRAVDKWHNSEAFDAAYQLRSLHNKHIERKSQDPEYLKRVASDLQYAPLAITNRFMAKMGNYRDKRAAERELHPGVEAQQDGRSRKVGAVILAVAGIGTAAYVAHKYFNIDIADIFREKPHTSGSGSGLLEHATKGTDQSMALPTTPRNTAHQLPGFEAIDAYSSKSGSGTVWDIAGDRLQALGYDRSNVTLTDAVKDALLERNGINEVQARALPIGFRVQMLSNEQIEELAKLYGTTKVNR